MSEHIIQSEVAKKIRENNLDRCEDIVSEFDDVINPLRDNLQESEKWDIAFMSLVYVRCGNDMIVCGANTSYSRTSMTSHDLALIKKHMNDIIDETMD